MFQRQLSFQEAVERALKQNYCNFDGRSSRSEYWWFILFELILYVVLGIILGILGLSDGVISVISCVVQLALFLPSLGLSVRRLHDINKSGWFVLLAFIPIVGTVILIVWACKGSDPYTNKYGPYPNYIPKR